MLDYGHGFKIGDVVYLKNVRCLAIVTDVVAADAANGTSSEGIRKATKREARKYRRRFYKNSKRSDKL